MHQCVVCSRGRMRGLYWFTKLKLNVFHKKHLLHAYSLKCTEVIFVLLCNIFNDTVAIGNPERHVRKASHCGSKQQ